MRGWRDGLSPLAVLTILRTEHSVLTFLRTEQERALCHDNSLDRARGRAFNSLDRERTHQSRQIQELREDKQRWSLCVRRIMKWEKREKRSAYTFR